MSRIKRGARVHRRGIPASVVDVHTDGVHISVLPDGTGPNGERALVRWRAGDTAEGLE